MDLIEYGWLPIKIVENKTFTTNCIDLLFVNKGTSTVTVNNFPLLPSESLPVNGNIGEITKDGVEISFEAGGTNALWVIRRFYKINS